MNLNQRETPQRKALPSGHRTHPLLWNKAESLLSGLGKGALSLPKLYRCVCGILLVVVRVIL